MADAEEDDVDDARRIALARALLLEAVDCITQAAKLLDGSDAYGRLTDQAGDLARIADGLTGCRS